jgi:adenylate kinase
MFNIKEDKIARNEDAEEPEDDVEEAKETLSALREISQQNNGVFPEAKIVEYIKKRLSSMPCRNQGYVLDGIPAKLADAQEIFARKSSEN